MNWHVEVIRFKGICHLAKCTQGVVSVCLFKPERLMRLVAFLWANLKKPFKDIDTVRFCVCGF